MGWLNKRDPNTWLIIWAVTWLLWCAVCTVGAGKDGHSGGMENMISASSLAETHISPDDMPLIAEQDDDDDDGTLRC